MPPASLDASKILLNSAGSHVNGLLVAVLCIPIPCNIVCGVLLMDSENSTFYIKTVDSSGMPQPLRIFDYTERTAATKQPVQAAQAPDNDFVTRAEFDALSARFDALTASKPLAKKKEDSNAKPTV